MKNSGYLVTTKSGQRGRTYHKEEPHNGKIKVHLVDEQFQPTGVKILCIKEDLTVTGMID